MHLWSNRKSWYFSVIRKLTASVSWSGLGGKDPGAWRVDCAHGIGQCAWCLITTPHGDKVPETRFLSNDFIICTKNSSTSPEVPGSKEHDPKDKETCWPDGTFINLLEIKIGITNCSGDYGNLTSYSLHPQTLWFKTMTPLILLIDLEGGKAQQGSHISAPLLLARRLGAGVLWILHTHTAGSWDLGEPVGHKVSCGFCMWPGLPTTGWLGSKGIYPWKSPGMYCLRLLQRSTQMQGKGTQSPPLS